MAEWQNRAAIRYAQTPEVQSFAQLNRDLGIFRYWYNHNSPAPKPEWQTLSEAWRGVDPYKKPLKQERWFEA